MKLIQIFLMGAFCAVSMSAPAQWQWLDKDGHKVFSDRAPPPDVPEKNILKQPGNRGKASGAGTASPAAPAAATQNGANAPKLSGVDKELEEKKKQAVQAQAAKRKAEEEKMASAKADSCTRAKQAKAGFDSGIRMSRTNAKGEREIMDDAARAEESKRIQSIIDSDCR